MRIKFSFKYRRKYFSIVRIFPPLFVRVLKIRQGLFFIQRVSHLLTLASFRLLSILLKIFIMFLRNLHRLPHYRERICWKNKYVYDNFANNHSCSLWSIFTHTISHITKILTKIFQKLNLLKIFVLAVIK